MVEVGLICGGFYVYFNFKNDLFVVVLSENYDLVCWLREWGGVMKRDFVLEVVNIFRVYFDFVNFVKVGFNCILFFLNVDVFWMFKSV